MYYTALVDKLIGALRSLPGIGPKSAQRMAFYLLENGKADALKLAKTLSEAISTVGRCQCCRTFSESTLCNICSNPKRDHATLCVVETPADIVAIEQTNNFSGFYFVLMGHLSPIDGIGPNEIGINELKCLLHNGLVKEVILATNPTVEGEATAHYISNLVRQSNIKCTRIAYGIPVGGELEYIDSTTLARALLGRVEMD